MGGGGWIFVQVNGRGVVIYLELATKFYWPPVNITRCFLPIFTWYLGLPGRVAADTGIGVMHLSWYLGLPGRVTADTDIGVMHLSWYLRLPGRVAADTGIGVMHLFWYLRLPGRVAADTDIGVMHLSLVCSIFRFNTVRLSNQSYSTLISMPVKTEPTDLMI